MPLLGKETLALETTFSTTQGLLPSLDWQAPNTPDVDCVLALVTCASPAVSLLAVIVVPLNKATRVEGDVPHSGASPTALKEAHVVPR